GVHHAVVGIEEPDIGHGGDEAGYGELRRQERDDHALAAHIGAGDEPGDRQREEQQHHDGAAALDQGAAQHRREIGVAEEPREIVEGDPADFRFDAEAGENIAEQRYEHAGERDERQAVDQGKTGKPQAHSGFRSPGAGTMQRRTGTWRRSNPRSSGTVPPPGLSFGYLPAIWQCRNSVAGRKRNAAPQPAAVSTMCTQPVKRAGSLTRSGNSASRSLASWRRCKARATRSMSIPGGAAFAKNATAVSFDAILPVIQL